MKKGMSLVVLVLVVIITTIILGVIVVNSNSAIFSAEKASLKSDISQLEILMSIYVRRKDGVVGFETTNLNISNLSSETLWQFEGETITSNMIRLYVIDLAEIDAENVTYGKLVHGSKDRYLYSIDTGKVYYEQGLVTGDGTYYYVQDGE